MKKYPEPPIGVIPEVYWRYKRILELHGAILRHQSIYQFEVEEPGEDMADGWRKEILEHENWIKENHNEFWLEHFTTA